MGMFSGIINTIDDLGSKYSQGVRNNFGGIFGLNKGSNPPGGGTVQSQGGGGGGGSARPAYYDPNYIAQQQQQAFNSAYALGNAYYGPDQTYLQQQQDSINRKMGLVGAQLAAKQADLQAGYDYSLAGIQARLGSIGVDRQEAYRQFPLIDQLQSLADQNLQAQLTGYNAQEAETRNQTAINKFGFMSDVTTRGAVGAPGTGKVLNSISESLTNAIAGIDVNRTQANLSRAEQQVQFDENRAQANDRLARLDFEAQGLGTQADALGRQLSAGMAAAGIDAYMTMADLMDALNSNNYQVQVLGRTIMQNAMQYASQVGPLPGSRAYAGAGYAGSGVEGDVMLGY